jgi:hypothetical protein
MDEILQNDELLMKYLDNEMNEDERHSFETELQQDAPLRQRLEGLRVAVQAVQQLGTAEKVRSIHRQMMTEQRSGSRKAKMVSMNQYLRYGIGVAAALILFIGIKVFNRDRPDANSLYNEAYVDYNYSGVRGDEQSTAIENFYKSNNYAALTAEAAKPGQSFSSQDSLLIGVSFLKTDKLSAAIGWLAPMSQQGNFRQDAEFYLALSYLRNKDYDKALALMNHIHSTPAHLYHDQFSNELIHQVDQLK